VQNSIISDANFGQTVVTSEVFTAEPSFARALVVSTFSGVSVFVVCNNTDRAPFSSVSTLDNVFDDGVSIG